MPKVANRTEHISKFGIETRQRSQDTIDLNSASLMCKACQILSFFLVRCPSARAALVFYCFLPMAAANTEPQDVPEALETLLSPGLANIRLYDILM